MGIMKGDSLGVFTGGWFDKITGKFRSALDVFTDGWFEQCPSDISISAIPQDFIFEPSLTEIRVEFEVFSLQSEWVIEKSFINIEIETSFDYEDYSALPNQWFTKCSTNYDKERELMQVLQMEVYNTYGVPCYYYKMKYDISASDKIWGENNSRTFSEYWSDVQVYYKLPRENKQWNKFGIEGLNNFSMYLSKAHFDYITSGEWIPKQGDLIQAEFNSNLYEIVEVKEESGMYFLDKRYTWELIVKPFKDEFVAMTGDVSASPLSAFANKPTDIFDITNPIDVEKEKYIYKPPASEKGSNDPFGQWG